MRIAIMGSGGVGGYFGARLALAGEDVVFMARGSHLQALRAQGLRMESIKGDAHLHPIQASDDPRQVGVVDLILVAVKAWQVQDAAEQMRPMLGAQTVVIPLLNGVEAPSQLAQALGAEHVLGGFCRIMSMLTAPGQLRHVGLEPHVAFNEVDNRPSPRVAELRALFERAHVSVSTPADIQAAMWGKFLFIAPFSGVGAVTRAPAGVLRSLPETRQMLIETVQEVYSVGRACGVNLAQEAIQLVIKQVDEMPADGTASMQRDIMEGRPSELEAQNGAVVRLGKQSGTPTPLNHFIYSSLLPAERKARGSL